MVAVRGWDTGQEPDYSILQCHGRSMKIVAVRANGARRSELNIATLYDWLIGCPSQLINIKVALATCHILDKEVRTHSLRSEQKQPGSKVQGPCSSGQSEKSEVRALADRLSQKSEVRAEVRAQAASLRSPRSALKRTGSVRSPRSGQRSALKRPGSEVRGPRSSGQAQSEVRGPGRGPRSSGQAQKSEVRAQAAGAQKSEVRAEICAQAARPTSLNAVVEPSIQSVGRDSKAHKAVTD